MMTTGNVFGTMTEEDLLGIPDRVKDGIKDLKNSKTEVVEIIPKVIEDELKELKGEVKRLTKVVDQFKKFYSNWHMFKHQLGL
jgi:hypothetical protein